MILKMLLVGFISVSSVKLNSKQHNVRFNRIIINMVSTADTNVNKKTFIDQVSAASIASAAVVAAAAVNAAVSMRTLSAPDTEKSYVYRDGASENRIGKVDEFGLPLIYDKDLIQAYWKKQGSALTQRWAEFLGYAIPYLTRVIATIVSGGTEEVCYSVFNL
jgi:hypothetical protein